MATLLAMLIACGLVRLSGLGLRAIFLPGALLVAYPVVLYWLRRLGGLTGDIYGAVNECVELAVLLMAVALLR